MNTKISVKERPILFSSAMVRAILEERKTQTRRVVSGVNGADQFVEFRDGYAVFTDTILDKFSGSPHLFHVRCPYGQPGDRLWVRETWCHSGPPQTPGFVSYRADGEFLDWYRERGSRWSSPFFMPRWASRILLEITGIRVQRVQEIVDSESDCIAEGIEHPAGYSDLWLRYGEPNSACKLAWVSYSTLWDSNNKKRGYGWDRNPWVWAISFRRVES
jgi:hypothetical protein